MNYLKFCSSLFQINRNLKAVVNIPPKKGITKVCIILESELGNVNLLKAFFLTHCSRTSLSAFSKIESLKTAKRLEKIKDLRFLLKKEQKLSTSS